MDMQRFPTIFFTLTLTIIYLFSFSNQCLGVPILTERGKSTLSTRKVQRSTSPTILGKYKDISHHKSRSPQVVLYLKNRKIKKQLSAKSVIIIDAKSGNSLFSISPDTPRQPASTIKIITGMIALKSLSGNEPVPVSKRAARQPRSKVYLDRRKTYKANDLINAVLLASANDASVALAEKIAGTEKSFAQMMTVRARIWGAKKTVCKTASGLTARGQKSTARDLAMIFKHVMQDDAFVKRMKRTKVRTSYGKLLRSHNKALWQVKGTVGGKTGFTHAAKQTYVGKFKRGNQEIIVALMGSNKMWSDVKKLVKHGFFTLKQSSLADKQNSATETIAVAEFSSVNNHL